MSSPVRAFSVKSVDRKSGLLRIFKVLVDLQDAHLLRSYYWHVNTDRNGNSYVQRNGGASKPKVEQLHKIISGATDDEFVRHVNGNTLDCRRTNLVKHPMSEKGGYATKAHLIAKPEAA